MKRFLVCGGVHGSEAALTWLRQTVIERRPAGVLFTGGILSPDRQYEPSTTEWGLTRDDALFMEHFFETLGERDVFTAVLPGPFDAPLEDFLRMGMNAEQEYPNIHLAHATLIEEDGVAVCGIGGCLVENDCQEPDTISRLRRITFSALWTCAIVRASCSCCQPYLGRWGVRTMADSLTASLMATPPTYAPWPAPRSIVASSASPGR